MTPPLQPGGYQCIVFQQEMCSKLCFHISPPVCMSRSQEAKKTSSVVAAMFINLSIACIFSVIYYLSLKVAVVPVYLLIVLICNK